MNVILLFYTNIHRFYKSVYALNYEDFCALLITAFYKKNELKKYPFCRKLLWYTCKERAVPAYNVISAKAALQAAGADRRVSMNEVIRQLHERKSVRVFTEREITPEDKALILSAATQAPSAGNQQMYTILDITDQKIKEELVKTCDDQPFIARAKMVLIFCADFQKWYDAFEAAGCAPRKPAAGDLMLAVTDAAIAAQNAVAAAHSLGIGSCYIGDVMENCERQRRLLNLPQYVFPAAMLVFGYPTTQQKERRKPERADMRHIVHENGYRRMDEEELREMFAPKAGAQPYEAWMQAFCNRKYNSLFSREMSRSVRMYLKEFTEGE